MPSIQFLGAAGTVTGSRFLLEHDGRRVLVDCGLFQGEKALRLRNWEPSPVPPSTIDAVVLTHAHIDHTGGLPRLVREGFEGPVYCTAGTRDLLGLLLPDSAHLQEEEARYANQKAYSRHHPALPLYTAEDARRTLNLLETFGYGRPREILPGIRLTFGRAGHIIGSATCTFDLTSARQQVVFTGDLGRYDAPILRDPEPVPFASTLVIECTYGGRDHGPTQPQEALAGAVQGAVKKGGMMVIPAFAVGRTQEILFHLRALEEAGRVPALDVYVDSPMACDATPIYLVHAEDHDEEMGRQVREGRHPMTPRRTHFVNSVQDSRRLNDLEGPGIIISASGMATGGRVLHHLKHRLPDARNTILFVGYQSPGTRGRRMLDGEPEIKIHGEMVPVRAELRAVSGFSAHADSAGLLRWIQGIRSPPRNTLLVHGEPMALQAMKLKLEERGWNAHAPAHNDLVSLGADR
jgi:metallo-beta-lactamase family protein